jgi:hypothetical protein
MEPSGFIAARAAGGSAQSAVSETKRSAVKGSPAALAARAAMWDSMSTASARVECRSAAFTSVSSAMALRPRIAPIRASARCAAIRDHRFACGKVRSQRAGDANGDDAAGSSRNVSASDGERNARAGENLRLAL